jgi:hypothetical protein
VKEITMYDGGTFKGIKITPSFMKISQLIEKFKCGKTMPNDDFINLL